jgi:hypothetical protein
LHFVLSTAEPDELCNSIPDVPDHPDGGPKGPGDRPVALELAGPDRNSCSALESGVCSTAGEDFASPHTSGRLATARRAVR